MAINNKPSVPAPAIFTSDPLEQIAMRGIGDDPKKSGLMYMFLNAFGEKRNMDQAAYMAGVEKANAQSVMLGQKELEAAREEAMVKAAIKLAEEGADVSTMPHLSPLFNGKPNTLKPDLMRSQIHKNYQSGGEGGGEAGGKDQIKIIQAPGGVGGYEITTKGPGGLDRAEAARIRAKELLKGERNATAVETQQFVDDQQNKYRR
jgi:hypothetical protein